MQGIEEKIEEVEADFKAVEQQIGVVEQQANAAGLADDDKQYFREKELRHCWDQRLSIPIRE